MLGSFPQIRRNSSDDCCRTKLAGVGLSIIKRDRYYIESLRLEVYEAFIMKMYDCNGIEVDRSCKNASLLMVGVITSDLGSSGC